MKSREDRKREEEEEEREERTGKEKYGAVWIIETEMTEIKWNLQQESLQMNEKQILNSQNVNDYIKVWTMVEKGAEETMLKRSIK